MQHRPVRTLAVVLLSVATLAACRGRDERGAPLDTGGSAIIGGDVLAPGPLLDTAVTSADTLDSSALAAVESSSATEIAAGELAAKGAATPAVKQYGVQVVQDFRELEAEADRVATELKLPSRPAATSGEADTGIATAVRGKTGRDFDVAYLDAIVRAHRTALQTLDKAASANNTPKVDSTLARARRKVQQHLDQARALRAKL